MNTEETKPLRKCAEESCKVMLETGKNAAKWCAVHAKERKRKMDREREAAKIANETPAEREARIAHRRARKLANQRAAIARETPEQKAARLEKDRERKHKKRQEARTDETPEQREARTAKEREFDGRNRWSATARRMHEQALEAPNRITNSLPQLGLCRICPFVNECAEAQKFQRGFLVPCQEGHLDNRQFLVKIDDLRKAGAA